jgi:hypothetical protein
VKSLNNGDEIRRSLGGSHTQAILCDGPSCNHPGCSAAGFAASAGTADA